MQNCFNNKPHEGLFHACPIKVFYDSHTACMIARKNSKAYEQHQTKSKSIYATLKEHQKFKIGDFVLLKLKPKAFRKESSVFYPRWSSQKYKIKDIHYDHHPILYSLEYFPSKKFNICSVFSETFILKSYLFRMDTYDKITIRTS